MCVDLPLSSLSQWVGLSTHLDPEVRGNNFLRNVARKSHMNTAETTEATTSKRMKYRQCNLLNLTNTTISFTNFLNLSLKFCQVMDVFCRRYIFIGMPESRGTVWHSLIMPFGPDLWLVLVLILLTLSALLCLKTKLFHRCGAEMEPDFSFLQSVFCVFSALCSQGKTEKAVTCKTGSV